MLDYSGLSLLVTGVFTGAALLVRAISEFRCTRLSLCSGFRNCAGVTCECHDDEDIGDPNNDNEDGDGGAT